jgi:hypothetical protein
VGEALLPVRFQDRSAPAEIDLGLLSGWGLDAVNTIGVGLLEMPDEAFDRLVVTRKTLFELQILINSLSRQALGKLLLDLEPVGLTLAFPTKIPGGQNGWF